MNDSVPSLATAFRFTPEAIRANRQGRLSADQRRSLWTHFLIMFGGGLLLAFAPILLGWLLIIWGKDQFAFFEQRALIGYLIGLTLGIIYFGANFRTMLLGVDLVVGRVKMIAAPVRIWGGYLLMDKYRFVVEETDLALIKSGVTYRVFLLPLSHTLLSIEFSE